MEWAQSKAWSRAQKVTPRAGPLALVCTPLIIAPLLVVSLLAIVYQI